MSTISASSGRISRRIVELDGLRGAAALGVVFHHAFPEAFFWGWACVDLFFVLSGYLITTILVNGNMSAGAILHFYTRRAARIWPVYYLAIVAIFVLNRLSKSGYPDEGLLLCLFFVQFVPLYWSDSSPSFPASFLPSWSVAVEEQFYLLWPLILALLHRRWIWALSAILLMASIIGRTIWTGIDVLLLTRADGLAFGCFLAWLLRDSRSSSPRAFASHCLIGLFLLGFSYVCIYLAVHYGNPHPQWKTTCFTGWSLLWAGVIGASIQWSGRRFFFLLRLTPFRWLGLISYGLYIYHLPIMHYLPSALARIRITDDIAVIALVWLSIFFLPAISWVLLERPILRCTIAHQP